MTLYSADVMDMAKPVKKTHKRTKVNPPEEQGPPKAEPLGVPSEPVEIKTKEPKQRTEKQIAALAKAQETRKRKREEALKAKADAEAEIQRKEQEIKAKDEAMLAKKEEAKEKRRLARLAKKEKTMEEEVDKVLAEKNPKVNAETQTDTKPPVWFQKYVEGVKSEQVRQSLEKVPKKKLIEESRIAAHQSWGNGLTRDRVRNEVDNHMGRMYSMIFSGR